jgi:hypothetical protein
MATNLRIFGYTERESGFMALAGLQSGYFLRRHFNSFIGRECGAVGQQFIDRALRLGHVQEIAGWGKRVIYHVCARDVYAQLGDTDNRNRRQHRPDTIRRRLMILDYVMARPAEAWLLTDKERQELLGRGRASKASTSPSLGRTTADCPDDRQPLSVDPAGAVRMAFVDAGLRGFSEWERFLKRRRHLGELSQAEVSYASCDPARFSHAESLFRRVVTGAAADGAIEIARLRAYFTARRLFDERRYEQFDQARLDRLREDRRVYAGEEFEQAYVQWQQRGDDVLRTLRGTRAGFQCQLLPHAYVWLSPVRFQERRPHHGPHPSADEEGSRSSHGQT